MASSNKGKRQWDLVRLLIGLYPMYFKIKEATNNISAAEMGEESLKLSLSAESSKVSYSRLFEQRTVGWPYNSSYKGKIK